MPILTGEIWSIAPGWLDGRTFDATMQYPFAQAMESFFVDHDHGHRAVGFCQSRLQQFTFVYPFQISLDANESAGQPRHGSVGVAFRQSRSSVQHARAGSRTTIPITTSPSRTKSNGRA